MIIQSALDTDTYKITMMQAILHQCPGVNVDYLFKCRTPDIDFRPYLGDIVKNVNKMCREVHFTKEDLDYLASLRFIKSDFIDFLRVFRFNYNYLFIDCDKKGTLHIRIHGPWLHTILFEVPILAIVSEIYSKDQSTDNTLAEGVKRLEAKLELIKDLIGFMFADFGTRRRHDFEFQKYALKKIMEVCPDRLAGTSNLLLAKNLGIKAIGTMAHEWLQAFQALYRVADSQFMALETWAKEYRGDLGVALTDVIGLKYFLKDFDMFFSKLFDGVRQDSGDPIEFGQKVINHYKSMRIDPKTKGIVFSDGLDMPKAIKLWRLFKDRINVSFGIGTNFTNDFDYKALQIVLKMVRCNGNPVAKLSDTPGKGMCTDQEYLGYLKTAFDRRLAE